MNSSVSFQSPRKLRVFDFDPSYGNRHVNRRLREMVITVPWELDPVSHIALEVQDIHKTCDHLTELGIEITRAPGPMKMAPDETGEREVIAFIEDPDGYKIELIQAP